MGPPNLYLVLEALAGTEWIIVVHGGKTDPRHEQKGVCHLFTGMGFLAPGLEENRPNPAVGEPVDPLHLHLVQLGNVIRKIFPLGAR